MLLLASTLTSTRSEHRFARSFLLLAEMKLDGSDFLGQGGSGCLGLDDSFPSRTI